MKSQRSRIAVAAHAHRSRNWKLSLRRLLSACARASACRLPVGMSAFHQIFVCCFLSLLIGRYLTYMLFAASVYGRRYFFYVIFDVSADLSLFVFQRFYQFLLPRAGCRIYVIRRCLLPLFTRFNAKKLIIFFLIASVRNFPYSLHYFCRLYLRY
jgi:hypothetical protein